jgi:hypothetical protein
VTLTCKDKKNLSTFAVPTRENGCIAQLDRASDYESEGLRFDSLYDHEKGSHSNVRAFFYSWEAVWVADLQKVCAALKAWQGGRQLNQPGKRWPRIKVAVRDRVQLLAASAAPLLVPAYSHLFPNEK